MRFPAVTRMDSIFWGRSMNLRHLRCFIAVGEELHFGRAARRLHVEQSPLSRTIRQLEADLGVTLLERMPRGVCLTPAGQVFLEEARRVLLKLEQARTKTRAVAAGRQGTLRIALAGGVGWARLATLLALCREEAPEVGIRLFEAPLQQVLGGLGHDLYDAALAMAGEMEAGMVAMPLWQDPLVAVIPARHPLLVHKRVPLQEVVRYPLVLRHPQACEEWSRQCERLLRLVETPPIVAEYVTTHSLMLALVAAGYGVGFSTAAQLMTCQPVDLIVRPVDDESAALTTYLLYPEGTLSESLRHFIDRAQRVGHMPLDTQRPP
jgi:DNA-binding transcriptional LysR family regulator